MVDCYYLCGPDGCGKSTFLEEIESHFQSKKVPTRHIWLRSPKILSKPLMAYCRLVGLTQYFYKDGIRYGGHEFQKSRFVSWAFPILQLVDFKLKWFFVKRKISRSEIVLFDRFALDTLADLMVSTRRFDLHKTFIGRSFRQMIPHGANIVALSVDEAVIRKRKKDTRFDNKLESRIQAFDILSRACGLPVIDNNRDFVFVRKDIFLQLAIGE